jgi:hypothetical protein
MIQITEKPTRTASGKPAALVEFYRQLARDAAARPGEFAGTVTELAARARLGRCALVQILNGQRPGRHSWKHLLPELSVEALFHLKQCSAWNGHAQAALHAMLGAPARRQSFFAALRQ